MPSKITLLFNSVPGTSGITLDLKPSYLTTGLNESFKDLRTAAFQVTSGVVGIPSVLANYKSAFNADYNSASLFDVIIISSTEITIEHPDFGFFDAGNVLNFTSGAVTISGVVDTADPTLINITDVSFSEAINACQDAQLDITTDVLAVKYKIDGGSDIVNGSNPFNFEQIRGAFITLEVENAEGNTINQNIQVPKALSVSSTVVTVVNSPSGATVTTVVSNSDGLVLTYSLDDITYQSSNSFGGITEGNYTSYIKDQLGCSIQVDFVVEAFEDGGIGVEFPIANIPSKSNSIRFARRVTHENCSNYKNDENTLGCELPFIQNPRQVNQLFQDCDVVTTQIESNYATIVPTVIQLDGTETTIPLNKKTNNIGLKDKRDSIKYSLGDGQAGIYFTSGDTYDFDTDIQNGTYVLNGGLPSFGFIGSYIILNSIWFQVVDIIFDESKNAEVLVINDNYIGVPVTVIVGSIYNLKDFEVYEFVIDMGNYPDQLIQVNITETDTRTDFPDIIFLSEILDIKERHENTVEIVYFSDINTDIFYSTGIINSIRIPIEYVEGGFEDDTEAEKTDVNVYPINAEIYETDTFHFQLLSKQLMRKVMQALAHKFVTIDEVSYVKESSPNMTALTGTNLYRLSAPMTKAESVYTSQGTGEVLE